MEPLYIEPIVGWRAWRYLEPGFLIDVNSRSLWEPFTANAAICIQRGKHSMTPDFKCECGYHAFRLKESLMSQLANEIYGEVNLWGKVIECETGWRAQYAYPLKLYFIPDYSLEQAANLSGRYGVEFEMVPPIPKIDYAAKWKAEQKARALVRKAEEKAKVKMMEKMVAEFGLMEKVREEAEKAANEKLGRG